jgi:hypothetical protein
MPVVTPQRGLQIRLFASQNRRLLRLFRGFWVFGLMLSLAIQAASTAELNTCMRICEVVQPKNPEQQRLDSLRSASKRASDAVKRERDRQKLQKAQQTIRTVQSSSSSAK